jgi:hypothetical protein
MAGRRETKDLKPINKRHRKDGSESPGRSASERSGGLENSKLRKPNLQVFGEGSMGDRKLADAELHSGGVHSGSTVTRTR